MTLGCVGNWINCAGYTLKLGSGLAGSFSVLNVRPLGPKSKSRLTTFVYSQPYPPFNAKHTGKVINELMYYQRQAAIEKVGMMGDWHLRANDTVIEKSLIRRRWVDLRVFWGQS